MSETRNIDNENELSVAQRVRDASRLMAADLEAEGIIVSSKGQRFLGDKVYDEACQEERVPISLGRLPPLASLMYPRQTRLGALLEKIPKPDGYLPKMHFPAWIEWPLHRKLPRIPLDAFIFSRGKLNEPLQREGQGRFYTTVDPQNTFNFLPAKDYNALHDPATHRYFKKPHVQKLLLKQGLITSEAEVICSQKEVNQYREYLEHFQTNTLVTGLRAEEDRAQYHSSLEHELRAYLARNDDYRVRNELARERQRLWLDERIRSLRTKIHEDDAKFQQNRAELKKQWAERRDKAKRCAEFKKSKRMAQECEESPGCKNLFYMEKQAQAELLAYAVKMRKELVKTLKQSSLMMAKSANQTKEIELRKEIMAKLEDERQWGQEDYQRRIDAHRQQFPTITEKRKANERRILAIMRKFLDLWRAYVKRRKARRADPSHQSSWDVTNTTRSTVTDLQGMAGHEKFDNFILNLVKMKRNMAAELENNEARAKQAADADADPV